MIYPSTIGLARGLLACAAALLLFGCEADGAASSQDASGGAACEISYDKACNPEEKTAVYYLDSCGGFRKVFKQCSADKQCYQANAQDFARCKKIEDINIPTASTRCVYPKGLRTLYEESHLTDVSGNVLEKCEFGAACFQDPTYNNGEALCHRSIHESQADKPYYNFGCSNFSMWMRHPTKLEMDCRCRVVGDGTGGAGGTGAGVA